MQDVSDLRRVAFGHTLQLQVLTLLRDCEGVDDIHTRSI